jgi:hypothetical protein
MNIAAKPTHIPRSGDPAGGPGTQRAARRRSVPATPRGRAEVADRQAADAAGRADRGPPARPAERLEQGVGLGGQRPSYPAVGSMPRPDRSNSCSPASRCSAASPRVKAYLISATRPGEESARRRRTAHLHTRAHRIIEHRSQSLRVIGPCVPDRPDSAMRCRHSGWHHPVVSSRRTASAIPPKLVPES